METQPDGPHPLAFGSDATEPLDAPNTGCFPTLDVRIGDEDRLSLPSAAASYSATAAISGALLLALGMASTWVIATVLDWPTSQQSMLTPTKVASAVDVSEPSKADRLEAPSLPIERAAEVRQVGDLEKASSPGSATPASSRRPPKTAEVKEAKPSEARLKQKAATPKSLQITDPVSAGMLESRAAPRPTPVPETKPATIPGWVIREADGTSAILEGPDGVRKVSRGDTVPQVGRIDSIMRWANRWMVATSSGLISTP